jgi:hypothetical protein
VVQAVDAIRQAPAGPPEVRLVLFDDASRAIAEEVRAGRTG